MENGRSSEKNEELEFTSFELLTEKERKLLLQAPALVSVLAASTYNKINQVQKIEALKLAHLKTFTAKTQLLSYYKIVEENFRSDFEEIENQFYPFDKPNREALKKEIDKVNLILNKLNADKSEILRKSLINYALHIKKSGIGILDEFLFPLPIRGINE